MRNKMNYNRKPRIEDRFVLVDVLHSSDYGPLVSILACIAIVGE